MSNFVNHLSETHNSRYGGAPPSQTLPDLHCFHYWLLPPRGQSDDDIVTDIAEHLHLVGHQPGGDGALLLHNMRTLGIDPGIVDTVVISHIHGDHVGGLSGFLEESPAVTVYLPQSFPEDIKGATREAGAELVEVGEPVEICEHVYSTGEFGDWIKEQSLVIETPQGLVVITGCAHPGVVSIVRQAKELVEGEVHLVLGGFHLGGASEGKIAGIVEDFQQLGVQKVAPCHRSGDVARGLFKEAYGEDFVSAGVGSKLKTRE